MFITLEIPPTSHLIKKIDDVLVNLFILLHSNVPCELESGIIYLDNPTDFPPNPVLVEALSETLDELPSNLPDIRRHASDGIASFTPELKKDKVIEIQSQSPVKQLNDILIFNLQLPGILFDGNHHLEGIFMNSDSQERTRFTLQLPVGYHDGPGHLVFGSLQYLSKLPSIPVYFTSLMLCLNFLLQLPFVQRLPLQQKIWMGNSITSYLRDHGAVRHENSSILVFKFLQEISLLLTQNKFRNGDLAIVLVGQLLDQYSTATITLGDDFDSLYSAPLKFLSTGLELFQKYSKSELSQSSMDSATFATFRYIRIALNFLLNQDLNSMFPSYQSCRTVIPLLVKYQQLFSKQTVTRSFRYCSRDSWGFLELLEEVQVSLKLFHEHTSTFFEGNALTSNLFQTRELLDNQNDRNRESQIFADLISAMTNISESQGRFLLQNSRLLDFVTINEQDASFISSNLVSSFNIFMASRSEMDGALNKYLRLIKKCQQTDATHIPSFRRLWSYQEFKYLSAKYNQLKGASLAHDFESNVESKSDPDYKNLTFVTPWAGTGAKGRPNEVCGERILITAMSFNNPSCLAVRTDSNGNPLYSGGIDEQAGHVFVADTLNHSIRVLVKPRHGYTLIGSTAGSSGSTCGSLTTCSLHTPRGLCTHDVYDQSGLRKTLLIIADSMNNGLRGVVIAKDPTNLDNGKKCTINLPDEELFSIIPKSEAPGESTQLANPTGVCSQGDTIYVCCRGDHTLRAISFRKKGWTIRTVAGVNGEAGYVDGSARQSKLSHPVSCTVAHGSIYFIEQGRIPAVKLYDGDQVKTIYSGSPLKNLTDICAGENGTLLICDRGNSCIWKLEIASGELFPLVTKSDLAGNDEINSSFLPSGIVKVADGAYLFSDLFRHQIFRLMTSECVMDSLHASHLTYSSLEELSSQSSHVIINYLSAAETLKQDVLHGVARLWRMKETILNFQYSSEIQRLAPFLTQKSSPKEGLAFFLRNAPSYVAIERLLRSISVTPDILFKLQESMALFAQEYDFSSPLIVVEKELTALANIFQMALPIAGQELFCKILKDERFRCPINLKTLNLLSAILIQVNWSTDRSIVMDLRREVTRWITRVFPVPSAQSTSLTSHIEVLGSLLQQWMVFYKNSFPQGQGESPPQRALQWLIRIHLDSHCFGFINVPKASIEGATDNTSEETLQVDRGLLTIQSVGQISKLSTDLQFQPLIPIFADTCSDVARTLNASVTIKLLLESLESSQNAEIDSHSFISFVTQQVIAEVIEAQFFIVVKKIEQRIDIQYSKAKKWAPLEELQELENRKLNPPIWEYYNELLTSEPELWGSLLRWYSTNTFLPARCNTKFLDRIMSITEKIQIILRSFNENLIRGHVTVDLLRRVYTVKEQLLAGWQSLECELAIPGYLDSLEAEMQNALFSLKTSLKILNVLAPESAISTDIQAAINNWSTLTLNTVRILLRQSLPSLALDYTATFLEYYGVEFSRRIRTYPPIPEMFLQGLDALLLCTEKVDLFTNIWFTHCNGEITDENLMSVREMWMKLFQSLLSGEISYSYLESNLRYLSDSNELCVLVQTCLEPQGWNYLEKTNIKVQELVSALQLKLKKWRKVQNLIQAKEYLLSVIDVASQAVLNESGVADIRNWGSQLEFLCRAVVNIGEWNSQTLNDLDKYWEFAEILDERMLRVSLNLLVSIRDNSPILTFMRIIRDDNAFTSSLEVALGLQEMECPAELWDTEHGRVDEKFLSMARNIRSYLYNYLYQYPPSLSTTRSFLELFSNLNEAMSPDTVAENIYECNRVRDAFMEIMQFKSDGASSSRLLKLYEPKCRSHWVLRYGGNSKSTKEKPGLQLDINEEFQRLHGHELTLEYVTVTGNLDVQEKQQSHALPELLDFQSNIVLSKEGSVLGGVFQETVDKFLHQLGWIRKLREVFSQLSAAGHFSYYPSYFISLSVQLDDNYFVEEVSKSQSILDNWVNLVSLMRKRYYFLNYFDIKRCYSLLSALHKYSEDIESNNLCVGDNTATFRDVVSILQSFISFINSDASSFQDIASFAREFCSLWFSQRPPGGLTATHLEPLCHCLHNCCSAIVPRCRPVYVNFDLENYVTLPALKNATIYTVCASSSKVEFEQALTLYISRKVWPEWETCLVCTKNTSLEIVNNFINRWRSSHANNRQNRLYYLLCCHLLPYHIQEAVCNMLREFQYETSFAPSEGTLGPLVLSCKGAAHSNPLIALFHNMNLAVSVLPDHLISHLFNCESGGRQVEVFCGKRAGCGKTFNILTKCSVESYQYVYVPVNGAVNKPVELKNFLNRIINTPKSTSTNELPPLYHFDIANTVKDTFASFLFEFCVLGIVPDLEGENAVTVPPRSAICIELAASMLDATLPHCRVYPLHWCRASRDTFQFSEESLRCGMGEQFSSPLYDGTWKIADSRLQVAADAFTRLRYVTVALNVLRYGKGTFPYDFRVLDPSQSNPPDAQNISFLTSSNNSNTSHQTLEIKEKSGESREQLTQRKVYEKLLMTGHGLDGRVAFDLLFDAMTNCNKTSEGEILQTQQNTQVSLWCMWNFVNVVYWQLVEMHHIDSPLNGACMPDANAGDRTLEEDTRTKRKIKGEIIYFILRTAVEFATRQSKLKHFSDSIVEVSVTGMKRSLFNKRWRRMEYDSDGKPCFRSPCGNFYLYYRALADCWVIDDIIETSGSTYAYSQSGDINSLWTSSPEWSRSSIIESKFETTANSAAYRGEAVRISGCGRLGGKTYCSAAEDGLYLRQPPYDDINGHPHYIKYTSPNDPLRRHLFFASERRWIVAPQCNEDQGYFIMGDGSAASRNWMYLPPDEVERQTSFTFIQRGTEGQEILRDEDDSSIDEYDIELVRWKDSNHECILFNNVAHTVAFLSARPKEMKNRLHPMLLRHLEQNSISVEGGTGRDDTFASSHWKTLSALTGVHKDDSQASKLLDGSYCLTGDSLLKILAIVYRVTCGIPVVLLGECGCGKTMLLRFLCAWMNVTLLCLDVHGGTTEHEILTIFSQASDILENQAHQKTVFVFLDEINTCNHMGLITEAICHRSINGKRLNEGIQILAALNPYRTRPSQSTDDLVAAGLEYTKPQLHSDVESNIDMKNLVYKVHPIPPTLRDFIFDFGSLDDDTEALYIQSMITNQMSSFTNVDERSILADMISRSQIYLRECEGDPSVVSLRDVQRCLDLLNWFYVKVGVGKAREASGVKVVISPLCRSAVLAIAHVYGYRLPSTEARKSFYTMLTSMIKRWGKIAVRVNFDALGRSGFVQTVLENMQRKFVNNLVVEPSIAMNQALTENLFVTIICILNKIPIFIVGKPGTSKTLAIQIIASNLQGKLSPMPLWKNFPAVYIFQYQCSPLSTSASILYQFESAKSYQEHSEDVTTVLLLDEVGLAENSPDMPLKVLHYMLVNPPIAIVGLSNWALDSSKMNRAVCLQRPEPTAEDIMYTGQNIVGSTIIDDSSQARHQLHPWLMSLARAFHALYSDQKKYFGPQSRSFIGMRDYYSLLKYLRENVENTIDPETLCHAVARNFGGRPDSMQIILELFHTSCFDHSLPCPTVPPSLDLIQRNLCSFSSRHLMILSANDAALQLLIGCNILDPVKTTVLVGSQFKDDLHELHIIQQINQVKNAMAKGEVVTLLNNESMFESLYDVLNQRYVYKTDIETGVERKMLRLALGPRSQLCPVAEGFKLIVIVDQQKAYDSLDLPLLNRFEKQVLFPRDLLHSQGACLMLQRLSDWCSCILKECGFRTLCDIFCGYYSDTLASLVLNITCYSSLRVIEDRSDHRSGTILLSDAVEQGKELLCRVAFPSAVLLSPTLRADISRIYNLGHVDAFACLKPQSHLFGLLASEFDAKTTSQYLFITTKSPISHFNPAYQAWLRSGENALQETNYRVLQLALISSERQFTSELNDFLQSCNFVQELKDKKTLIILCDPLLCDGALISHAKYLCARRIKEISERKYQRNIVFVIHLPPGVNSRHREFILDVHPPWKYQFVDDIRYTAEISNFSLSDLIEKSAYELYSSSDEFFIDALWGNFHAALARCIAPQQPGTGEVFTIKVVKDLLQAPIFFDYVKSAILECFKVVSEQETDSRLHVNLACSTYENTGGTFREALLLALDCLFLQSFAHVIRTLDVDFNLHCLHHIVMSNIEHSHIYSTWINLAHKVIGKSLSNSFAFLSPTSPDYYANCITRNNSLHGILRCRFPFSERIISAIGNDNVRFQIESVLGAETEQTQLEQMARSISSLLLSLFDGEADGSMLFLFLRMNPMGYLHDFVQIVIPPLPGISDQTYFNILKLIADIHFPSHGYLPSIIQACYWTYERILFHIFSLFSIINIQVRESSLTEFFPFHVDEWILSQISTSRDDSLTEKVVFGLLNCLLQALLTCTNDDIQHFRGFNGIASLLRIVRKVFPHLRMLVRECLLQQPEQDVSRILLPYWRVLYVYLILNECISYFQRHKHDVNKGILDLSIIFQLLQNLLSLHSTASPLDPQMLLSFSAFCCESSKPLLPLTSSLLRTFILEFIQSEHEFIAAITSISPYTTELLETLGILLSTLENSKFLPVRRCILWLLSRLISQDNRQDARKVVSENILSGTLGASEVALMYVNHLEDQISLQTRHNSQVSSRVWTHLAISERNEFLHHLASEGPEIFEYLAFLKISIRRYSFSLSNYLSTTSLSDSEFPPIGNQEVEFVLSESEDARFFLLACLRDLGGNDLLLTYLQRPNNHPYLPTGVKLVTKTKNAWLKLSFLNPFPFILGKEQYLSACDVFKHSVFGNSSSPLLASWLKNHRTRATNFCSLIAAVHTEMGVGDDVSQLTEYLDKMQSLYCNCYFGQVNESDIARTIMNWVLRLDRRDDRTKYEHNLNQLLIHIGIIAIQHPQSLTAAFIEDVSVLNRLYLPGMPQNEMSTLARAMGYVGWYKCPNGHPYTVGECTYPMEESRCSAPGCGARIGGRNHNSAVGTVRIGVGGETESPGYIPIPENDDESSIARLVLRFYVHSSIYLSTFQKKNRKILQKIIRTDESQLESISDVVREKLELDYSRMKLKTQFADDDLAMALHQVFKAFSIPDIMNIDLRQANSRHHFEDLFQRMASDPIFASRRSLELIQATREENTGATTVLMLKDCFQSSWNRVTQTSSLTTRDQELSVEDIRNVLWRLREPLSFESFYRKFSLNSSHSRRYPVLNAVLENENVLPFVKYIADILAWHSFLFSVLPPTTTREQASTWTLADILSFITPEHRRSEGWKKMHAFCRAFNESFPLVAFLYECNPNPFITNDGKVDLTGGKRGGDDVCMNENSTLNFSLPSSSHGETDATGLCTIRLLTTLQDCHNRIIQVLNEIPEEFGISEDSSEEEEGITMRKTHRETPLLRPGMTPSLRAQMQDQVENRNVEPQKKPEARPSLHIPVTSLRTSYELVRQRLLIYDRQTILMPIVAAATEQSMSAGYGRVSEFDFYRINADLRETLLATSSPLALHIFQFQYAGEIRKSGGLRGLGAKSKQIPLSVAIRDEIWKEIDTQHRLTKLLALLEGCIAFFVASATTHQTDGAILLEDYILKTLLMDPKKWEEIRCPTLAQHVYLYHLQCLFLDLEQRNGQDPLQNVALAYREPLSDHLHQQLRHIIFQIDFSIFTPILREFCTEQLTTGTWPSDGGLKEFLGYSTEIDLDLLEWFHLIPEELQLRHAYEFYKISTNPAAFLSSPI